MKSEQSIMVSENKAEPLDDVDDLAYQLTEQEMLSLDEEAELKSARYKKWAGLVFLFLVIVFISWFYIRVERYLTDASKIPMAELIIEGQREYVEDDDVRNVLLKEPAITNYFSVDVDQVQIKIESLPWVYNASVRKIWPDSLRIHIQEQPVVAFWNESHLLNEDGIVFEADIEMAPASLVKLYGAKNKEAIVLDKYEAINTLLELNGYKVSSMTLNSRNALTVVLTNGITLRLGREDMISRIQRYIDFITVVDIDRVQYIDLRYDTGFSVGWKSES